MNTARVIRTVAALLLGFAVAGAPALTYAQHSFGGGGGHFGGGGGHFGGGGGHFGGGGGHFGGGGHAMGHIGGGAHFAAPGHFGGGYGGHYAAPHFSGAPHFAGHGAAHFARPGFAPGGFHGNWAVGGWHGWRGGYWHGGFWPHVWFGPGFAWFLPVLPFGYATYWWGGVPYYYYNNLYYTYSPDDDGYVVTDPPPVADQGADASAAGAAPDGAPNGVPPPAQYSAPGQAGTGADMYVYPRNGQSAEQTQNDKYECHSWAVNQTGFDPTHSTQPGTGTAVDYRRAMIACLDARGYSAR